MLGSTFAFVKTMQMKKEIITEIVLNASAEQVWNVLTDFNRYHEWNPFLVESRGEAIAGTRLENTMLNGDKKMKFKPQILTVEKNNYFDWLGHLFIKGLFDGHHYFRILPISENQVKLIHGEDFSGILSSWVLGKIGDQTRENFVRMNMALKLRLESMEK